MKILQVLCISLLLSGCAGEGALQEQSIRAMIIGTTRQPDPVLLRVREYESRGVLTGVMVLESFPVQIWVNGPRSVIKQLRALSAAEATAP